MKICDYGCGEEAKYQFKNGKYCCSKSWNSCLVIREKNSQSLKKVMQEVWNRPGEREKRSKAQKVAQNRSDVNEKLSKAQIKAWKDPVKRKNRVDAQIKAQNRIEVKEKNSKAQKEVRKDPSERERLKKIQGRLEVKEKKSKTARKQCLNGHSSYMNKCHKNPSKEELKFREEFEEVNQELNLLYEYGYKVLENRNYSLDIGIFPYKIAIEFDGWHHFDTEEHRQYHKKRQQEIEALGWRFLRYNIFQPFPTKEQVLEDIKYKINGGINHVNIK